ncbi:MAG: 1-acyl-sn-glycerol-3-phosphate acyltransferase [Bacteroidia bacterium]|nr:1-acyl-sn-glycerol-3-phosphate acyltransferase [Bacteroidia bacterium]
MVFILFKGVKMVSYAHRVSRMWAGGLFAFMFAKLNIDGKNLIDPDETYVLVSNHRSLLDVPLFALSCDNTFRFLSKAEMSKVPVMGYVISKIYISVSRGDFKDRKRSLIALRNSLDEGISVFICPEGTRNKSTEALLPLKDGAFALAIEKQVPIAVLTIQNSDKLMPPGKFFSFKWGTIYASWAEPISTIGMTQHDLPRLRTSVEEIMLSKLGASSSKDTLIKSKVESERFS